MRVRDVMRRQLATLEPDATVGDAARAMRELDVGALPVRDQGVLLGVVTDRDITVRTTAEGYDPEVAHVRDAMTSSLLFCLEDESVEEAVERMAAAGVRRLVVLDGAKELVGLLSL